MSRFRIAAVYVSAVALSGILVACGESPYDETPSPAQLTHRRISQTAIALELFRSDHRRYPSAEEGLAPLDLEFPGVTGFVDGWGFSLRYTSDGSGSFYSVCSVGADLRPSTVDDVCVTSSSVRAEPRAR